MSSYADVMDVERKVLFEALLALAHIARGLHPGEETPEKYAAIRLAEFDGELKSAHEIFVEASKARLSKARLSMEEVTP